MPEEIVMVPQTFWLLTGAFIMQDCMFKIGVIGDHKGLRAGL